MFELTRRDFLGAALTASALPSRANGKRNADGRAAIYREIDRRHDEAVGRLQTWLRQPSIAAQSLGMSAGCELTRQLALDAGFQRAECLTTSGQPCVFATLDAGARVTLALYFMYDVKQVDPAEWSSPPWEARLLDKPGLGQVVMGRGAVNQKGPQAALLAALHAIRGAGRRLPVNLVLVAEGEEEIGSPSFAELVLAPQVRAALTNTAGVIMPDAAQAPDGGVIIELGNKGDIECELIVSGERWGRGPTHDIHSGYAARVDQPAWHLVQALNSLVTPAGEPAIDGFWENVKPLTSAERGMLDFMARRLDESSAKRAAAVQVWARDAYWRGALEDAVSRPTLTIEGITGGYTGPGGKTILPHKVSAKLDIRLVPDMTAQEIIGKLKAHLARRGFGDLELIVNGGIDETTTTAADAPLIRAERSVYRAAGIDPLLWPRGPGSWPGHIFTGPPLHLAAGHFGLGYGEGAHGPDEYYLVESRNPRLFGMRDATRSFVDFLYALA